MVQQGDLIQHLKTDRIMRAHQPTFVHGSTLQTSTNNTNACQRGELDVPWTCEAARRMPSCN
jgi:hypothetical protein